MVPFCYHFWYTTSNTGAGLRFALISRGFFRPDVQGVRAAPASLRRAAGGAGASDSYFTIQ